MTTVPANSIAALLHRHVTRIVRRGIGRAILVGIIRLIDVLLLLLDLNLDVLDPCFDLGVVDRSNSNTAYGLGLGALRVAGVGLALPVAVPNVGAAVKEAVGVAVWLFSLPWSAICSRSALASDLASASMPVPAASSVAGLHHADRFAKAGIGRVGIGHGILIGLVLLLDILLLLLELRPRRPRSRRRSRRRRRSDRHRVKGPAMR